MFCEMMPEAAPVSEIQSLVGLRLVSATQITRLMRGRKISSTPTEAPDREVRTCERHADIQISAEEKEKELLQALKQRFPSNTW